MQNMQNLSASLNAATLQQVLKADTARGAAKFHEYSGYALAGATPLALMTSKGILLKATDMVFAFAIPTHMHCSMNALITDYLPKAARGPSRYALLGASSVTFLGLLKLNLFGPGITETVRMLWRRPDKAAPAKK